jgi:DNA-binding Xre family transcriptional regulator
MAFEGAEMIKWTIPEILRERGWNANQFAKAAGLTIPAAYRLSKDVEVHRIDAATLDKLCAFFGAEPGDLLERVERPISTARKSRTRLTKSR